MKTLLILFTLLFAATTYSQSDTTILQKRFEAAEYNIDRAGGLLEDAANGFGRAWFFTFVGSLTSGVLIATLDKTEEGNINPVVFIPSIIGVIGGVWNFFSAAGDMREAGYYMRKSKKKY